MVRSSWSYPNAPCRSAAGCCELHLVVARGGTLRRSIATSEFPLRAEPIIELTTLAASARQVELVRALRHAIAVDGCRRRVARCVTRRHVRSSSTFRFTSCFCHSWVNPQTVCRLMLRYSAPIVRRRQNNPQPIHTPLKKRIHEPSLCWSLDPLSCKSFRAEAVDLPRPRPHGGRRTA